MKKILCPTDFSETANNAITYAAKLAQKMKAQLTLFNVQSLADLTPEEAFWGESLNAAAAAARLEELCEEVSKVFKISCYGDVATSVTSVNKIIGTKASGYDLIVMGTNGPDELFQFFLGSNTYQVIKKSTVPLMLIPEGCGYSDIQFIVYAFDYWRNDRLPMTQIIQISKALGSELLVLQVMEESYSHKAELEVKEAQKIMLDLYKDQISLRFDTIYASELIESVHDYVLRNNADLLALCTEHHRFIQQVFHKSVVKAVSKIATYPVFVFHA